VPFPAAPLWIATGQDLFGSRDVIEPPLETGPGDLA
jgi:hypothetical protein